ncbi:MAG: uridine kinase [Deltaproteobacteria bacterium]|nr:uridine kinase [Deltaproteobacteria bacterium]
MKTPFFVGIAGGTGSGKTTVARKVAAGLPPGTAVIIEHDAYYHDHCELQEWERLQVNYDHPDSLDNDLLMAHLTQLKSGEEVATPIYDYKSHCRILETRTVNPASVVILEGILVFTDERLRQFLDLKIFVDTDADIRIMRRVRRDIEERGRDFNSVREQYYKTVRPMHQRFVEPSKRHADLIIPEGGSNRVALDAIVGNLIYVVGNKG